jgi:hypothetical protein
MASENEPIESAGTVGEDSLTLRPAKSIGGQTPADRPRGDVRGDDRRRKRGSVAERKSSSGYGDGIERATCLFYRHTFPPEFPVNHRPGLATSRATEVDRRLDAVLLCDRNHEGDCLWPDGESIGKAGSVIRPTQAAEANASTVAKTAIEPIPNDSGIDDRHFEHAEGDTAEQETRPEPEDGGDDQDGDGPRVGDEN